MRAQCTKLKDLSDDVNLANDKVQSHSDTTLMTPDYND